MPKHFGLLDTSDNRWQTFKSKIEKLNLDADEKTTYKVFYFARHGEGYRQFDFFSHFHAVFFSENPMLVR
jgi:hypothetical protein